MIKHLFVALVLIPNAVVGRAQTVAPLDSDIGPGVEAVLARTDELNHAFLHPDIATLDRLIAEECLQITENGTRTKPQWLAGYKSGASRFVSINPPQWRRIRVYGDVTAVTSASEITMLVQNQPRVSRLTSAKGERLPLWRRAPMR